MSEDLAPSEPSAQERAAQGHITRLLQAAAAGDPKAPDELMRVVYDQLHLIAAKRMAANQAGHTLQATALVHEAYLRMLRNPEAPWSDRQHFFRAAALAMRHILIDHARANKAEKRGGGRAALSIGSVAELASTNDSSAFLALDDAISRLERVDALAASVVQLRFYAGLSPEVVAETLGVSERTARRSWTFARGWLRDALEREQG